MAWQEPKTNWKGGKEGDVPSNVDLNRIEGNIDVLSKAPEYGEATGNANIYAVTVAIVTTYYAGLAIAVKINVQNTGASTLNVNGLGAKAIKRGNGNDVFAGLLKSGSVYTLRYNGTNFILQGEGGDVGTAQPEHVLEEYTVLTNDGIKSGTMTNQGAKVITPSTSNQTIVKGYHNGSGYVKGDADLIAGNIKSGVDIFGKVGNYIGDTPSKINPTRITLNKSFSSPASEVNEIGALHTITGGAKVFMFQSEGDGAKFSSDPYPDTRAYHKCTSSSTSLSGSRLYLEDGEGHKINLLEAWYNATGMNEERDMYLFNFAIVFANDGNHMGLELTYDAKNYGILGYNNIKVTSYGAFDYKNTFYLKYHCYCTSAANTSTSLRVYGEIVYF